MVVGSGIWSRLLPVSCSYGMVWFGCETGIGLVSMIRKKVKL